jgi:rhamnosyltransferase
MERLLAALRNDVDAAVLVDNGSPHVDERRLVHAFPSLLIERLETNKGLAAAQNAGIALAGHVGASYVLFLDQDSIPEPGMAARLCRILRRLGAQGLKVACVGPQFRSVAGRDPSGFARLGWFGLRRTHRIDPDLAIECDFLMSSGSLVPMDVLREVGGMEEGLFIDQVDTEWCLRARAKGYQVFGACGAVLDHRLGEDVHRVWIGRWRNLFRHKPFRYYYIFRNSLLLFRRDYVSAKWMLFQLSWLLALFIRFGILRGRQGKELRMMLKGIAHGIRGVTGKLEAP